MAKGTRRLYAFGPFRLDLNERVLFRENQPVALTPKALETLLVLVERHGHIVDKSDLMNTVWPDTAVEEGNLSQNVYFLRRVLGEPQSGAEYIETIARRGYRFTNAVEEISDEQASSVVIERRTTFEITTEEEEEEEEQIAAEGLNEPAPRPTPDAVAIRRPQVRRKRWTLVACAALAVGLGVYGFLAAPARTGSSSEPFGHMTMSRLTSSGNVMGAAISPDGRYLVHVSEQDGRRGLWLRQTAAASPSVPIVPSDNVEYWGLTFSPDGNHVFYVVWRRDERHAALYRVSILGGTPQKLFSAIDTRVSFSPDGARFAYMVSSGSETRLMVANADGSLRRVLATRNAPDSFALYQSGPAWSPDGSLLVCAVGIRGMEGRRKRLIAIGVDDGVEAVIGQESWAQVGRILWQADGRGLVFSASPERWSPRQIWHMSYPGGSARRITNDVNEYRDMSATADSHTIVAVQVHGTSGIWLVPDGRASSATRLTSEVGMHDGIEGMTWTASGELLTRSNAGGNWDIWAIDPGSGRRRQLTFDPHHDLHPASAAASPFIVFSSDRDRSNRFHIWRMETDGSNPTQLTSGDEEVFPQVSPDGHWVVYQQGFTWFRNLTLWKVPVNGGEAVPVTNRMSMRPAISPDGRSLAFFYMDAEKWRIGIVPLNAAGPMKTVDLPSSVGARIVRWTPDGRGVAYIDSPAGVSNIWIHPLDGGKVQQLTDFQADQIHDFAWSPDGTQLALMRGVALSDLVDIRLPSK